MQAAERFARTPCNRFLGFELRACSPERVELELPARAELGQEEGVVQGGLLTALADTAAVYLLLPFLPDDRVMTGTGCSMSFVGAASPTGAPLRAVASPLRVGRTMAVCESVVTQDGRLVAKGTFTFLVRDRVTAP